MYQSSIKLKFNENIPLKRSGSQLRTKSVIKQQKLKDYQMNKTA